MNNFDQLFQPPAGWPPLIQQVMTLAYSEMSQRFSDTLHDVEPVLLRLAREAEEDSEKDRVITAIEHFIQHQDAMCSAFLKQWQTVCERLILKSQQKNESGTTEADKLDLSHLSILGDEELTDKIALQNLSSSTAQELKYLLTPIRSALEQVMPGYVISRSTVAFLPSALAECVFEGLQALDSDNDIRQAVLGLYRQQYFLDIETLYRRIIALFEQQGYKVAVAGIQRASEPAPQPVETASVDQQAELKQQPLPHQPAPSHYGAPASSNNASASHPHGQQAQGGSSNTAAGQGDYALGQQLGQLVQGGSILPSSLPRARHSLAGMQPSDNGLSAPSYSRLSQVPEGIGADMSIVTVSNREVDGMLETMQRNIASAIDSELPDVHKTMAHLLKSKSDANSYRVMSQVGENVINLVSLLFEFIQHNDAILPLVSNLLMRLQIPYMRLAIGDDSLFSNREHSGRLLLNKLAELAIDVSDSDSPRYQKIHDTVQQLTQKFDGDPLHIEQQLVDIGDYLDQCEADAETEEGSAQQQASSEEQQAVAEDAASQVVSERIHRIDNSLVFHSLLEKIWTEVLKVSYLQHGQDTEQWQHSIELLDEIIWSTLASNDAEEKRRLLKTLPSLVPQVENTFDACDIDDLIRSHFLDQLHEIHVKIIRGAAGNDIVDQELEHSSAVRLIVDDIEEEVQAREEQLQNEREELAVGSDFKGDEEREAPVIEDNKRLDTQSVLEIISGLRPGIWMEYLVKAQPVRCKIAFYAPNSEKYIFVEGSGRKLFDRIRPELLVDIQDNLARVVEGGDMFEQAMSSVVSSIREQRSSL